jgi:hypothetical protein
VKADSVGENFVHPLFARLGYAAAALVSAALRATLHEERN